MSQLSFLFSCKRRKCIDNSSQENINNKEFYLKIHNIINLFFLSYSCNKQNKEENRNQKKIPVKRCQFRKNILFIFNYITLFLRLLLLLFRLISFFFSSFIILKKIIVVLLLVWLN